MQHTGHRSQLDVFLCSLLLVFLVALAPADILAEEASGQAQPAAPQAPPASATTAQSPSDQDSASGLPPTGSAAATADGQSPSPAPPPQDAPEQSPTGGEAAKPPARQQGAPPNPGQVEATTATDDGQEQPPSTYRSTVRAARDDDETTVEGRATQEVTRRELDERQVRSAPDALRYTPGVYVQQTAAGQGSPYIRGLTGRRTLLLFDGLPINHALFRQGPNQYFFTVDSRTIERIEVLRGSASVELGAGAMGGAILVHPLEPTIIGSRQGLHLSPSASLRHATADGEVGLRAQLDTQLGSSTGLLGGVGWRTVGQLESGGPIEGLRPWSSEEARLRWEVPRFEEDGRTMKGTGFDELTGDLRLVHRLSETSKLTLAGYAYRQFDAPRTDQCPPPEAPDSWCLLYEEQYRTHIYGKLEAAPGWSALHELNAAVGVQRQHERRRNEQVFVNGGSDDIDVLASQLKAETPPFVLADDVSLRLLYGLDGSFERVGSEAWSILDFSRVLPDSDTVVVNHRSRGQYLDGSSYQQGGLWLSSRLTLGDDLLLRAGGRAAAARAFAPADAESDSRGVDQSWLAMVGHAGLQWRLLEQASLLLGVEQGFRPPNLDDLTARQITGQGYQIDNPDLQPEKTLTVELGGRWRDRRLHIEGWLYQTYGRDWMDRRDAVCPPALERECQAARWAPPVQLVNLDGTSIIRGAELDARIRLPLDLQARGTLSYAWGEGDSPLAHEAGQRRPLSRIPPLNGTVELRWRHPRSGVYLGLASRWAADQDRRSFGDENDKRIPPGGTPGYAVFDLRAGLRRRHYALHAVAENLADTPYRIHGSSVNGPARGLMMQLELRY